MNLNRHAREFYTLGIVTQPPITTWEASFDAGRTWHPGEQVGQDTRWLLRGSAIPDDPARPAVEVALTVRPLVRWVDDPEVVVRDAPHVIVS